MAGVISTVVCLVLLYASGRSLVLLLWHVRESGCIQRRSFVLQALNHKVAFMPEASDFFNYSYGIQDDSRDDSRLGRNL